MTSGGLASWQPMGTANFVVTAASVSNTRVCEYRSRASLSARQEPARRPECQADALSARCVMRDNITQISAPGDDVRMVTCLASYVKCVALRRNLRHEG